MVQLSELFNLGLVFVLGPLVVLNYRRGPAGSMDRFYGMALGFMLGAYVTTILEGFIWADALNLVEHGCLAVAGIFFAIALYKSSTTPASRV